MSGPEKLSYLVPRDPSIVSWSGRVKLPGPLTDNVVKLGLGMDAIEEIRNEKLKVFLRIKPCQLLSNAYVVSGNSIEVGGDKEKKPMKNVEKLIYRFQFTSVFNQNASQGDVFKECVMENLQKFIHGKNDLLFTYGTTNSGKTYTMQGNQEQPGVIPRTIQFVFNNLKDNIETNCKYRPCGFEELQLLGEEELEKDLLHKNYILNLDLAKYRPPAEMKSKSFRNDRTKSFHSLSTMSVNYENVTFRKMENNLENVKFEIGPGRYSLWVSMFEIYNEQIYDLLGNPFESESRVKLGFAEDEKGRVYIKNLRYVSVSNGHEAFQVFQFGKANLRFSSTALNERSSRSHCIFTLTLARFVDEDGRFASAQGVISRFSFCDLAGMESVKKALTQGQRLAESKCINVSLSIFVKCLTVIKENQATGKRKLVPYRESKLTRLFREAMMGKSTFSIIVNITPEPNFLNETLNVLKFSTIAQQIIPISNFSKLTRFDKSKKSKYAALVEKAGDNSIIDWESARVLELENAEENKNTLDYFINLVSALEEQLAEERERCENVEKKVREDMMMKISKIVQEHNEANWKILECESQRMQEMYEQKEERLMQYLAKEKEKAKKRKFENDYSDYPDIEKENEKLREELDLLKSENVSLRDIIVQMNADQSKMQMRCTQMAFELSEKEKYSALKERHGDFDEDTDELTKELRVQLIRSKTKITEMKTLLEENTVEYRDLLEFNKKLREENERLVRDLATTSDVVKDLKKELEEQEAIICAKTVRIEELEHELDRVNECKVVERDGTDENVSKPVILITDEKSTSEGGVGDVNGELVVSGECSESSEGQAPVSNSGCDRPEEEESVREEGTCKKCCSPLRQRFDFGDRSLKEETTPERLSKEIEKLSMLNSEAKKCNKPNDDVVHPSLIRNHTKSRRKGKKAKDVAVTDSGKNEESIVKQEKKQKKATKKLFTENFDSIDDLDISLNEPEIPRLRPRKIISHHL